MRQNILSIIKFLTPYLFPEHHKKITRSVILIGATSLLYGFNFFDGFYWLLVTARALYKGYPIPEFTYRDDTGSVIAGVVIIALGLLYSVLVLFIQRHFDREERLFEQQVKINEISDDYVTFVEISEEIKTNGAIQFFLCQHDFGISWPSDQTEIVRRFIFKWEAPEHSFRDLEIKSRFIELLDLMRSAIEYLAYNSHYLLANENRKCIFDPSLHNEMDMPDAIMESIHKANEYGDRIEKSRSSFIEFCNLKFSCLPIEIREKLKKHKNE